MSLPPVRTRIVAMGVSLAAGAGIMALKFYVYRLTGSQAVLSDALESIINIVASAFALASVVMAAKPPDPEHPYGHEKIEFFSAGFEGALIILAAIGIFWTSVERILAPRPLPQLDLGLLLLLGASLLNLALGVGLIRVGRRTRSLAVVADGRHVLTDVSTSGGVLLGLLVVRATDLHWLDGAVACAVGTAIVVSGVRLVRQAFAGLMDQSDPALLREIAQVLSEHRRGHWIDIHELRAWRAGDRLHLDFHLILPRTFTLEEAHAEVKALQAVFLDHFGGRAEALIHVDPCTDPECPICARGLCSFRSAPHRGEAAFGVESLTRLKQPPPPEA